MRRNVVETMMGAVVLVVAAMFVVFAYNTAQIRTIPGYPLKATFLKLGGLPVGSDVRISGIKVGTVTARELDPLTFNAVITMTVARNIALPEDTVAMISSEGLIGEKYVRLVPGTAQERIPPGGTLRETRGFRSLEDQVGEIIFLATSTPGPATPAEP